MGETTAYYNKVSIMKEVLYEVRCLKSTEDMILALAGQLKQLSVLLPFKFMLPLNLFESLKKAR